MSTPSPLKRIFVYAEDIPVHGDVVASGLSRAAPPLFRSILDHIDGIAIYPIRQRFRRNDVDYKLAHLCTSLSWPSAMLCKALRRLGGFGPVLSDACSARLLAPALLRSPADLLLAFIGADYGMLPRAANLARLAGKSCVFYVVDDFLAATKLAGASDGELQRAKEKARAALHEASYIFTITNRLGDQLRESYGISATTLNLAFEPEPRPTPPVKNQIIFVGSINFLYAEGLRDLIKTMERVRSASGIELSLRLTVPLEIAQRELGDLPSFVMAGPIESSQALAREIASSLFSFLPYSFHSREKAMVSTSFPSKSMEYLAYARSIVVYGPEYGVATESFREKGLPTVVSSTTELEETMQYHLSVQPDHSLLYRGYLAEYHSLMAARNTMSERLGLAMDDGSHLTSLGRPGK